MYYDSFGLLNSRKDERNSDNALLWTVQHYFLTGSQENYDNLVKALDICRISAGVYYQHPAYVGRPQGCHEDYMSHDQSTAIMMFSWYNNLHYHKEMWTEMKRQWFFYDNVNPPKTFLDRFKNRRPMHPRDIIHYGILCGSILWKLLLPILWLIMLVSGLKKKKVRPHGTFPALDGKLLNYVRIYPQINRSFLWRLQWHFHTWLMNRNWGGWHGVFAVYFPFVDHPSVIASKG